MTMVVIIYTGIAQTNYKITCYLLGVHICIFKCVYISQVSLNFYCKNVSFFWLSRLCFYHFDGDAINCCLLRRKAGLYLM